MGTLRLLVQCRRLLVPRGIHADRQWEQGSGWVASACGVCVPRGIHADRQWELWQRFCRCRFSLWVPRGIHADRQWELGSSLVGSSLDSRPERDTCR